MRYSVIILRFSLLFYKLIDKMMIKRKQRNVDYLYAYDPNKDEEVLVVDLDGSDLVEL